MLSFMLSKMGLTTSALHILDAKRQVSADFCVNKEEDVVMFEFL